ncbi:MAG: hypothetical protein HYS74_02530 [Parcubacteria group bacterium]|nr:hypothetical protein [Parcubacteria group bacterium]
MDYTLLKRACVGIFIAGVVIALGTVSEKAEAPSSSPQQTAAAATEAGEFPVAWEDIGRRLVLLGVLDESMFRRIYGGQDEALDPRIEGLLSGSDARGIGMGADTANETLTLLWAFGLANESVVLRDGPMGDPRYGGPMRFASTGGWTLARGAVEDHYNKHALVTLTDGETELLKRVAANVYRPCCNNPTLFPDCNHGMAMLGLLELLIAGGATEDELYAYALAANALWFPDVYDMLLAYAKQAADHGTILTARDLVGREYASADGVARVREKLSSVPTPGGTGCSL